MAGCVLHGLQVTYVIAIGVLPLAKTSFNSIAGNAGKLQNKKMVASHRDIHQHPTCDFGTLCADAARGLIENENTILIG